MPDLGPTPLPDPPPAWVVRAVVRLRRWLLRLADRLLPPEVAVFEHAVGFGVTVMLREVARLGVADHLAGGSRSVDELAVALGVDPQGLGRVLRALAYRGVFEVQPDGRVGLGHVARGLVTGAGSSQSFAAYVGDTHNLMAWDRLGDVLRDGGDGFSRAFGEGVWTWYEAHESARRAFAAMMADRTVGEAAAVAAAVLPCRPGGLVCDVGGGTGALLSEVCSETPAYRGSCSTRRARSTRRAACWPGEGWPRVSGPKRAASSTASPRGPTSTC